MGNGMCIVLVVVLGGVFLLVLLVYLGVVMMC